MNISIQDVTYRQSQLILDRQRTREVARIAKQQLEEKKKSELAMQLERDRIKKEMEEQKWKNELEKMRLQREQEEARHRRNMEMMNGVFYLAFVCVILVALLVIRQFHKSGLIKPIRLLEQKTIQKVEN